MKKHIFAFICVFVLMFNTFNYTQTKAMDIGVAIDVGSEILYEGWDMIQSIFNGFVISLGQYAGYADKASAMAAFYNDWGDVLTVLTGGYLSPDQVEQSAIGVNTVMPRDFGMTGAVMRDFIFNYGGYVADPNLGMYADINMKSLASWNRYNDLYAKRFLDAHNADIEQHPTYPDPQFEVFIDRINGTGFDFLRNLQNIDISIVKPGYNFYKLLPWTDRSFYQANKNANNTNWTLTNIGTTTPIFGTDSLDTVYITSSQGVYSVSIYNHYEDLPLAYIGGTQNNIPVYGNLLHSGNNAAFGNFLIGNSNFSFTGSNAWDSQSFSGSLGEVFTWLQSKVRNVNIYVDGVLWSYVGQVQEPYVDLGIDHPRYDENGQMIGNDVFFPEQDLKADLVKFTELIDDKILSGESIDLDDLIDAGVLTDADGNILTDENRDEYIKSRDISSVITDALVDTDTADLLPDAPDPPDDDPWDWHFPTIVIPEGGDPDPRDTGLSVLARIVNVTNQSLPGELITMFWGIVITMLILGIIKILHK